MQYRASSRRTKGSLRSWYRPSRPGTTVLPEKRGSNRPRFLVVLALVGFFYGTVGPREERVGTLVVFTSSHDSFVSTVQKNATAMLGLGTAIGTPEEREKIALRKAEALWSRRGVLLPLAGAGGIAALLILLAHCARSHADHSARIGDVPRGSSARSSASRASCSRPVVGDLHTRESHHRDRRATGSDLGSTARDRVAAARDPHRRRGTECVVSGGVARYLGTETVKRYFTVSEARD